ncbi:GNAT family N-acetyltransferase [Romboutsia sp.]|uniref:GNAT family N-acetyltransferase n=1 Tax=Romboutsia sp. TaxID=1965302 RepID=UPI003F407251
MGEVFLIEPSKNYREEFISMIRDYEKHEDEEYFNLYKEALEDFDKYVDKLLNNSKGIGLPKDRVASSTYWLVNKNSDVLGVIRIRHELNSEFLRNIIGHIGYDISPSNRRKGYGETILRLGLEKVKEMNISNVLVTCKSDNHASSKVIEKNNGVFECEIVDSESNNIYRKYWINMNSLEVKIKKYYESYDEDSRLIKDKSHSIEFITTTKYLDRYISKGDKVLEVGAGTGKYSFYFAENGCDVTALELSEKHVEIMKNKLNDNIFNMEAVQGNALDLSRFEDEIYDSILCLGPMYHLTKEEDRTKCIKECLRVLKPGGFIAIAYISKFAHFTDMVKRNKDDINDRGLQSIVKTGVESNDPNSCFYFSTYDDIEKLMNDNEVQKTLHIATDGISDMLRDSVNDFTNEEFNLWMQYHLDTCENPNLIGYSKHCLYIGRKN